MAKRRDLFDPTDPADLQPEQRQCEIVAVLAADMIHMRQKRGVVAVPDARVCPGRVHRTTSRGRRLAGDEPPTRVTWTIRT